MLLVLNKGMARIIALLWAVGILLSACSGLTTGRTFDIPVSEAKTNLLQTEVPNDVLCNPDLRAQGVEIGPSTIVWKVTLDRIEFMNFSAEVTPNNSASTHVVVSVGGPASGKYAAMDQALNDNVTVKNLYLAAMEEEVAAALEKRNFNILKITPQLLAAMGANLGTITQRLDSIKPTNHEEVQAQTDREMAEWNAGEEYSIHE